MRAVVWLLWWVIVAGLGETAAAQRQTLTVYSPHGKELLADCEQRFEAAHPEVDVRWLDMGSQEVLDRVRAEARRPRADVWYGAPATLFAAAAQESLLAPYRPSWAQALPAERRDPGDRWYGTFLTPEVILYNRERIAAQDAPRTVADLLQDRYAGRIVLREPVASGTMLAIFGSIVLSAHDEREGLRTLARLDGATALYAQNPTLLFLTLARGNADLTLWNLPDAMLQIERYKFPFAYVIPQEGTPVLVDGIAIVARAPHPQAARDFYEFVTSPVMAVHLAQAYYRIPARTDLDAQQLPEWMRTPVLALPMDWARLARDGGRWMNIFDTQIKGRGKAYLQGNP
jgi:iron(III) transport system substrate-binding protein